MAATALLTPPPARSGPVPRPWTPAEYQRMLALGLFAGRAVGLDRGTLVEGRPGDPIPRPVALTIPEYSALWSGQFFHNQRVQLVRGVIVQEPFMNPPHATGIRKATVALGRIFGDGYDVRVQIPLDFVPISRPHPDVAVVTGDIDDYATRHPTTAELVVEVADDSLFDDTTTKAEMYAEAGIADYWVLDVGNRQLLVFRDPEPLPKGLGATAYRTRLTLGPTDAVSPLAAPAAAVRVADLLP